MHYLFFLSLVLLMANKTRKSKKDEMRWKGRKTCISSQLVDSVGKKKVWMCSMNWDKTRFKEQGWWKIYITQLGVANYNKFNLILQCETVLQTQCTCKKAMLPNPIMDLFIDTWRDVWTPWLKKLNWKNPEKLTSTHGWMLIFALFCVFSIMAQ